MNFFTCRHCDEKTRQCPKCGKNLFGLEDIIEELEDIRDDLDFESIEADFSYLKEFLELCLTVPEIEFRDEAKSEINNMFKIMENLDSLSFDYEHVTPNIEEGENEEEAIEKFKTDLMNEILELQKSLYKKLYNLTNSLIIVLDFDEDELLR